MASSIAEWFPTRHSKWCYFLLTCMDDGNDAIFPYPMTSYQQVFLLLCGDWHIL